MTDPENLKKSMRYCSANLLCDGCPHEGACDDIVAEALEYIEQLEKELKEAKK